MLDGTPFADGSDVASDAGDRAIRITFFDSFAATRKTAAQITLQELVERIRTTTAVSKDRLPWLKLALFGDKRTDKGSLRHDENVLSISGTEIDYDACAIPFADVVETLLKAGVLAIVYTSPSHTERAPRWRVLCPTSEELPPERRAHLIGRLNGLLAGAVSVESWTLSQSYYYGAVNSNPAHRVELIDGTPIDLLDDLDEIWRGKPNGGAGARHGQAAAGHGPVDEDALLAEIASGASYHVAAVRLLGKWAMHGVPLMDARARLVTAFESVFPADRDARWETRRADVDRCLADIYGKEARKKDEAATGQAAEKSSSGTALRLIDPTSLHERPVPEREWIVQDWLPIGHATACYGDGGTGKTLLAQELMTSCAAGVPWCGLAVMRCRSLALFCEDSEDELHRRQHKINDHFGVGFADLGDMRWVSGIGADNAIVSFVSDGRMHVTERFDAIARAAEAFQARLIVLDTAADLFAGNENDRHQVRQFIGLLSRLAQGISGAVLLNAHPSRSGLSATGDLDGGSTAWSNTVRSRWSLARPKADPDSDEQPDHDERILTRRKANYAGIGDTIKLRWVDGVLAPVSQPGGILGTINREAAENRFLALLDLCAEQGVTVSHSRNSGNFAPKVFAKRPDRSGYTAGDFDAAMARLFGQKRIKAEGYGRAGDMRQRLVRA